MSEKQKADLDALLRQAPLDLNSDAVTLRAAFEAIMQYVPIAPDVRTARTELGGVDALEVTIDGIEPENVILYFHGGVYVIGSAQATVPLTSDLARRTGAKVITVDYRLAPENPYPAAVEDARSAYEWLISQGVDPSTIAMAGESAGGGLVAATLLALRDDGRPLPSSALLMSPYVDLTLSGSTIEDRAAVDVVLTPEGLRLRIPEYVGTASASDPYISPVFGDLHGLPPMLIQVGTHEVLLSDAVRLAGKAAEADVEVTLEVVPGVPHVFQGYAGVLDEGDAALRRATAFLGSHFA